MPVGKNPLVTIPSSASPQAWSYKNAAKTGQSWRPFQEREQGCGDDLCPSSILVLNCRLQSVRGNYACGVPAVHGLKGASAKKVLDGDVLVVALPPSTQVVEALAVTRLYVETGSR